MLHNHLHLHAAVIRRTSGRSLETFKKRCYFEHLGALDYYCCFYTFTKSVCDSLTHSWPLYHHPCNKWLTSRVSRRTVSGKHCTLGFPVRYGSPRDVFAASSSFVHLHTLRIEEKWKTAAVVTNAIVHKQGIITFITNKCTLFILYGTL